MNAMMNLTLAMSDSRKRVLLLTVLTFLAMC